MDRVSASNEISFRVGFTGHGGHLSIEPLPPVERLNPLRSLPDFVLPPAFPAETSEMVEEYIKKKHLLPRLDEDVFAPEKVGRQWEFDWFDRAEIMPEPSMTRSVVVPSWEMPCRRKEHESGLGRWEPESLEVDVADLTAGAQESGALPRIFGPAKDFVRGSISSRPFRPGGLDNAHSLEKNVPDGARNGEWAYELLHGARAQVLPPGFKDGLHLGDLEAHSFMWNVSEKASMDNNTSDEKLNELSVQFDDLFNKAWENDVMKFIGDGHMQELDTKTEFVNESLQIETKEQELHVVESVIKESSVLDEILSAESVEESTPKLDGITDIGGEESKETWVRSGGSEKISEQFQELVPDMALNFPFELDPFQKEAIFYLEKGASVFVAAHTSAGKTVVAEYAFALASKHCTRAVYTAPIKTISNQKYRDFCGKFDVGLLTGDVSLRPEASCLIMTTEILRSMLYKGADIIRDIEWVIFDEVHYVNDAERGVVWEEVIIMLPRHINIVLLSATVPNTWEFADWIGRTKQKIIHLTGTTTRPVPLEHCLFFSGELYKICENEKIINQGLKAAKDARTKKNSVAVTGTGSYSGSSAANERSRTQRHDYSSHPKQNKHSGSQNMRSLSSASLGTQSSGSNNWGSRRSEASVWLSLINKLSKKSLLPVIIFCFSKNRCDKSADNLNGTDLTTSSEKSEIRVFCDKAFSRLKGSDRNLPQVVRVQGLLRRGIGVHHAGLLPIVKEVVEMLFCRGVVKILFSTETFAMGVNAPARTVVFDTLRKFDGKEFRQILPGEYTQMAGRAGRRGIDKIGTVVVLCRDEIPEEKDLRHVIVGNATRLESQFRLTYIMILQLLRVEELKVEDMLKRSFAEFHAQKKLPEKQQLLMRKLAQPTKIVECIKGEPAIEDYYEMYSESERYSSMVIEAVMLSPTSQQFLTLGRVVVVNSELAPDHLLGVIVKAPSANYKQYIVLLLTPELPPMVTTSDSRETKDADFQILAPKAKRGLEDDYYSSGTTRKGSGIVNIKLPHRGQVAGVNYEVRVVENNKFVSICNKRIKIDQVRLLEDVSAGAYSHTVQQLLNLKSDGKKYPPALDPVKDLKVRDMKVVEDYYKLTNLLQKMAESKCHDCVKLEENIKLAREMKRHKAEVNDLEFEMSDEALQQMPDFQGRIDVLKEIGCIDADLVVQIKGRVACEMNSGEELICTECLFENQLNDLEPEEAVAIMSAFVFQQKNTSEASLTPKLSQAKNRLYDTAIRLGELQANFKLQVDPQEYAQENLKFGLVEVVYEWAKGTPFADICELTDVPEGMIVRTILRLDETCREFRNAAAIMGNSALHKKMEIASNAIKRDIVFAASLYITGI